MASFPVPTGMAFEAVEVREDNAPGYQFNSLSVFDADQAVATGIHKEDQKGIEPAALEKVGFPLTTP
jgi:hypothetical protein